MLLFPPPLSLPSNMSSDVREANRDLEVQTPVETSYIIEEKLPISSEPSTRFRKTSALSSTDNRTPFAEFSEPKLHVRRLSRAWWKSQWNDGVRTGRMPRFVYGGVAFLIIATWTLFTVITALGSGTPPTHWVSGHRLSPQTELEFPDVSFFVLEGLLKNFDPISATLGIEWSGMKVKSDDDFDEERFPLVNDTGINRPRPIEIYRDTATTLWIASPVYDPNTNGSIRYKVANSSTPAIGVLGWTEEDSFDTQISCRQAYGSNQVTNMPQFAYPFDMWEGTITFIGNSVFSDKAANTTKSFVVPPLSAVMEGHALNWVIEFLEDFNCFSPRETLSSILAQLEDQDPTNLKNETLLEFTVPCHLRLDFIIRRPYHVMLAALISVGVNWAATLFIFILTCEVLLMRRGFMMSGTDLLGVTFTALFALPSIRMLLPGAPDFGALIDIIGILPNVMIISICVSAIAIAKLNRKKKRDSRDE